MASYKDKDGRWRYRFRYKNARYSGSTPRGHNTKRVADQLEKDLIEKLQARAYTGVMPSVKEFVKQFLEHQHTNTKELTYRLQKMLLELHVVPHIGHLKLDAVGQRELDGLKIIWSGSAAQTINTRLGTVMRMLNVAVEWEILERLPKVAKLKIPKTTPRFLTYDEAARLLDAAEPQWRSMMLIGLRTGLRIGELRGLQWGDVNLSGAAITVRRTAPGMIGIKATAPKSGRFRVVPLTSEALACLRALHDAERARLAELGRKLTALDHVWPTLDSGRVKHEQTRSVGGCKAAIDRTAAAANVPDCTWHTLRHTYASWLVQRGISLRVIQELLGHANIGMTERYAHLAPNAVHHAAVAGLDLAMLETAVQPEAEECPNCGFTEEGCERWEGCRWGAGEAGDQPVAKALPEGTRSDSDDE